MDTGSGEVACGARNLPDLFFSPLTRREEMRACSWVLMFGDRGLFYGVFVANCFVNN